MDGARKFNCTLQLPGEGGACITIRPEEDWRAAAQQQAQQQAQRQQAAEARRAEEEAKARKKGLETLLALGRFALTYLETELATLRDKPPVFVVGGGPPFAGGGPSVGAAGQGLGAAGL